MMKKYLLVLIVCLIPTVGFSAAPVIKVLPLNSPAPDFNLPGVDGKQHRLSDYAKADVLAIVFTCNHCPAAQAYQDRLMQMVKDYQAKSFQLVAISGNDDQALRLDELRFSDNGDSLADMKDRAQEMKYNFPYLYDGDTQVATMAYGGLTTPHIFIFDKERKLRYQGRIDSNENPSKVVKTEAQDAIDALLAGNPVTVTHTRSMGCSTKWRHKRASVKKDNEKWEKRPVTLAPIDAAGVEKIIAPSNSYRLINVWASWCAPCVAEFPDLVKINRIYQHRNFEFITFSLDAIEKQDRVSQFLKRHHAAIPLHSEQRFKADGLATNNYIYSGNDREDFFKALDAQHSGVIPYLMLVAPNGKIVARWTGDVDLREVRVKLVDLMGRYSF